MSSQNRNKSIVWKFFIKHPIQKWYAICKICQAAGKNEVECVYFAGGGKNRGTSTSSLMKHMKRRHLVEWLSTLSL